MKKLSENDIEKNPGDKAATADIYSVEPPKPEDPMGNKDMLDETMRS